MLPFVIETQLRPRGICSNVYGETHYPLPFVTRTRTQNWESAARAGLLVKRTGRTRSSQRDSRAIFFFFFLSRKNSLKRFFLPAFAARVCKLAEIHNARARALLQLLTSSAFQIETAANAHPLVPGVSCLHGIYINARIHGVISDDAQM